MGFSVDSADVRVDFFSQGGKWRETVVLKWDRYQSTDDRQPKFEDIQDTFRRCLDEQFPSRYTDCIVICLEPCHEYQHPLMCNRSRK